MRENDFGRGKSVPGTSPAPSGDEEPKSVSTSPPPTGDGDSMKFIPWEDIWTSLSVARLRGNGDMIDVFYDTLFREAVFDNNGAWAFVPKKR